MNEQLLFDLDHLPQLLEMVKRQGLDYLNTINAVDTTSKEKKSAVVASLPHEGVGAEKALREFNDTWRQIIVASSGPRYLGYVTGGTTPASILGDWLTAVYDQNSFATTGSGDTSAQIELVTIQLLLQLFELPATFLGGFVTGATMSNFSCLAVARQWAGKDKQFDAAKEGIIQPIKVLSATPHSSAIKSLAMLGMGSSHVIKLKTMDGNREAIDMPDLEEKLKGLDGEACILISSGGTVNTVDFDDMQAIAKLKEQYKFWWHVDAAFGAFAACSPMYRHLLSGWEKADSITIDCHKWLNVPYDSAVFFVREEYKYLQVETFQNSNAPYLGDPLANFSYLNFLPENSRRLRALPAWFSLMAYGKKGYQDIVENSIHLAKHLGGKIEASEHFELLAPVRLNTVCFTLSQSKQHAEAVQSFLATLNQRGKVFMTPTCYNGSLGIRAAFVNWRTTAEDVERIWQEMKETSITLKNCM